MLESTKIDGKLQMFTCGYKLFVNNLGIAPKIIEPLKPRKLSTWGRYDKEYRTITSDQPAGFPSV